MRYKIGRGVILSFPYLTWTLYWITLLKYQNNHCFISPHLMQTRDIYLLARTLLIYWTVPFRVTDSVISCINWNTHKLFVKLFQIFLEKQSLTWNIPIMLQDARLYSIRILECMLFLLEFLLSLNYPAPCSGYGPNALPLYPFQIRYCYSKRVDWVHS